MSVVGLDVGNFKSSVGIARAGGIEIVANEYSDRVTPTYVAFTNTERYQGHAAAQQEVTNNANTISGFKRLLARKFNDNQVAIEKSFKSLRISANEHQQIQYNIDYMNEMRSFNVDQIMAMFLTKLKTIGESNTNGKVTDCVIGVPSFMTDGERRALLDAASIAGLNCLKLMNETTAVALCYGIYNPNLPEATEAPHKVVFVDMGYTQIQASVVSFNKGKLRMNASVYDANLGGRDFDRVLMDHFQKEFLTKYGIDAYSNKRATVRLRTECEKMKKLMSSNSSPIPINIECFMNDIDVSGKLKREDFEKMAEPLLARVRKTLASLLAEAKLVPDEIDLVEIVGGSTRTPVIKQIIHEVYGKQVSTTLNQDEACARGCTLMCAILSPTFKVKDFKIEDSQMFPITLTWKGAETDDNELEVFPQWDKIPMSKLLTIYKRESFEIEARYRYPNNIPFGDARIGKFFINNVTPNAKGENSEVKLKARITKSGIFEISSPQLIEVIESTAEDAASGSQPEAAGTQSADDFMNELDGGKEDKDEETAGDEIKTANADAPPEPDAQAAANSPIKPVKKKKTRAVDLPLSSKVPQHSKAELNYFMEQELAMIAQDRKEKERSEAKNSVEEYIYESKDKLSGDHSNYISEENKAKFLRLLEDTETWLYSEEAENQEKSVYVDRLNQMKNYGDPMRKRHREAEERPHMFEELGKSLQLIKKAINLYYAPEDEKYKHLQPADIEKVEKCVAEKHAWFEEKNYQVKIMKLTEDPPILCSQIKLEKDYLDRTSWAILNKPKPKVEPPKVETPKEEPAADAAKAGEGEAKDMDLD